MAKKKAGVARRSAKPAGGRGRAKRAAKPSRKPAGKKAAAKPASGKRGQRPSAKKAPARKASAKKAPTKKAPLSARERDEAAATPGSASTRPGVGDRAPSFMLKDDSGKVVSSESLRGRPYILYFYPKDDTPGCTLEACGFRDTLPRFGAKGVRVLGVSPDSEQSHQRFKTKYGLPFPLLSDPEKTLAKAYAVWVKKQNYGREYMGILRSTFVVDKAGKIQSVWRGVRVPGHVETVLDAV